MTFTSPESSLRKTKKSCPTSSSCSAASSALIGFTANCFVLTILGPLSSSAGGLTLANPNRPRERHDVNPSGTSFPQGGSGRIGRRSGCVDIVDEGYVRRHIAAAGERRGDVAPPFAPRQLALAGRAAGADEQRLEAEPPAGPELPGEPFPRVMTALEPAIRVGGDANEILRGRPRHGLDHDLSGPRGEPTQAAFLPGRDDASRGPVVRDGRPRRRERQ